MHLLKMTEEFSSAMEYLKDSGVERMYPAHCTCLEVKAKMYRYFPKVYEVGVGMCIEFEDGTAETVSII